MSKRRAIGVPVIVAALAGMNVAFVDQMLLSSRVATLVTVPMVLAIGLLCTSWALGRLIDRQSRF